VTSPVADQTRLGGGEGRRDAAARLRALFFEGHAVTIQQTPDRTLGAPKAVDLLEILGNLGKGDIRCPIDQAEDIIGKSRLSPPCAPGVT